MLRHLDSRAVFGGLQGSGSLTLTNTSAAAVSLSVGGNNASSTFSGGLRGNGSLTKVGSGTLSMAGVNTYVGDTTVSAGAVQILGGQLPGLNEYVGSKRNREPVSVRRNQHGRQESIPGIQLQRQRNV